MQSSHKNVIDKRQPRRLFDPLARHRRDDTSAFEPAGGR